MKEFTIRMLGVILFVIVVAVAGKFYLKGQNEKYADLYQSLLEKDSIIHLDSTTILKLSEQVNLSGIMRDGELKNLRERLDKQYGQKVLAYTQTIMNYRTQIDSLQTKADTIIIDGEEKSVRSFNVWAEPSELYLSGWFEPYNPYRISFDTIDFNINLQIILSRAKHTDVWATTVNTNSKLLKINDIAVSVDEALEVEDKWSYALGVSAGNSIGLLGGIGYRDYTVYLNTTAKREYHWAIGVMKKW